MLNDLQRDALAELFNIRMGIAASMLSEVINKKIDLLVPVVSLMSAADVDTPAENIELFSQGHVVSTQITYGDQFQGEAFLLFPAQQAKWLVNLCLGEKVNEKQTERDLLDTDFDVLKEVANILLNAVVGGFGDMMKVKLEYSLPIVEVIFVSDMAEQLDFKSNRFVLLLKVNFIIQEAQITGVVMITLGMDSISLLLKKIDEMLGLLDE